MWSMEHYLHSYQLYIARRRLKLSGNQHSLLSPNIDAETMKIAHRRIIEIGLRTWQRNIVYNPFPVLFRRCMTNLGSYWSEVWVTVSWTGTGGSHNWCPNVKAYFYGQGFGGLFACSCIPYKNYSHVSLTFLGELAERDRTKGETPK